MLKSSFGIYMQNTNNTREFTIRFVIHLVLSSSVFHFLLREIWLRRQKHTDIPENAGCYFHH